jgi:hypothetical protein
MRKASRWLAAIVALVVLFTFGLAASEALHKKFHQGAGNSGHECAVTFFAHGHLDSACGHVPIAKPRGITQTRSEIPSTVLERIDYLLLPERAPPCFS